MNEDRVSLIRAYYRAVDTGTIPSSLHLFTEDCVLTWPSSDALAESTVMRGRSELSAFYEQASDLSDPVHGIDSILATDEIGAVDGVFTANTVNGGQISFRYAEFFKFNGQQIAERTTYFHRTWR